MNPLRPKCVAGPVRLCQAASLVLALVLSACASAPPDRPYDVADVVIPRTADQVRDALVEILIHDGYAVEIVQAQSTRVSTGYRHASASAWEWLQNARLGVIRNQVEARITELTESSSILTLRVQTDSKTTFWEGWTVGETPVPQGTGNYLRLVRNYLKVL